MPIRMPRVSLRESATSALAVGDMKLRTKAALKKNQCESRGRDVSRSIDRNRPRCPAERNPTPAGEFERSNLRRIATLTAKFKHSRDEAADSKGQTRRGDPN